MPSAPSTTAFTYDELDAILRGAGGHDGAIGIVGLATVQHQPAPFNSLSLETMFAGIIDFNTSTAP